MTAERNDRATGRSALRVPTGRGYRFLLMLIVVTYLLALLAEARWVATVLLFVQTGTVWQALRISGARTVLRVAAAGVFALALTAAAGNVFAGGTVLTGLAFLTASGLYFLAPISIVRDLAFRRGVDHEMMSGALAAYLLIGMAFGFAYACLGALQPGPLFGEAGDPDLGQALFFSFVTMTTTGYGDMVPVANPAQSIAVLEALAGQLFLVTAVAKVVENWRPRAWQRDSTPPAPQEHEEQP